MTTEPALTEAAGELPLSDVATFAALLAAFAILMPPADNAEQPDETVARMVASNLKGTGWAKAQGRHGAAHARTPKHFQRAALLADPVVTAPV